MFLHELKREFGRLSNTFCPSKPKTHQTTKPCLNLPTPNSWFLFHLFENAFMDKSLETKVCPVLFEPFCQSWKVPGLQHWPQRSLCWSHRNRCHASRATTTTAHGAVASSSRNRGSGAGQGFYSELCSQLVGWWFMLVFCYPRRPLWKGMTTNMKHQPTIGWQVQTSSSTQQTFGVYRAYIYHAQYFTAGKWRFEVPMPPTTGWTSCHFGFIPPHVRWHLLHENQVGIQGFQDYVVCHLTVLGGAKKRGIHTYISLLWISRWHIHAMPTNLPR